MLFCVKKITLFRLGNIFIMPANRACSEYVLILEICSDLRFKSIANIINITFLF